MSEKIDRRQCDTCSRVLPLDKKHFPRVRGGTYAFQATCRKCKAAKARQRSLDKIESSAVDAFVKRTVSGGSTVPHTAELLESIMHYFGGANGFASIVMKQYFESPPGSRGRNSILEMVVRLASKNTEQGGAKKPIDLYTEEELEEEINSRLRQAVVIYEGAKRVEVSEEVSAPGLPSPDSGEHFGIPAGGTEDTAGRIEREANRSLEAIQANSPAERVSQLSGE